MQEAKCHTIDFSARDIGLSKRRLDSVADFDALSGGIWGESVRFIVVCFEPIGRATPTGLEPHIFFLDKDVELHFKFYVHQLGFLDNSSFENNLFFDELAYFRPRGERRVLNGGIVRVGVNEYTFEFWATDPCELEEIVMVDKLLRDVAPWLNAAFRPGG